MKNKKVKDRADLILQLIGEFSIGVEVGTLKGEFSKKILSKSKGKLYLVDAWRQIPGLVDFNNPDHNGHLNNLAQTFMNVYEFGERVCIIRELSTEASKLFKDNSLDFVYIDAGHDKKSVTEDLTHWYKKVKKGGIIIGDDYFDGLFALENIPNSTTLVEVKSAVDKFAKKIGKKVYSDVFKDNSIDMDLNQVLLKQWWIKK